MYASFFQSASWGSQDASYSSTSSSFDNYIYSRDSLLVVLAAGNYGSATTTQTVISPTTAKNVVSVGATDGEGRGLTSSSLGSDYLAYFSSRGPTTDGRIKVSRYVNCLCILSSTSMIIYLFL